MYLRASTQNPLGFRPGTAALGYLSARHAGPDWKAALAARDAQSRAHQRRRDSQHRAQSRHAARVDAYARGDYRTLSGLSGLDLSTQMVKGAQYVFHFRKTGITLGVTDMGALAATVAADSNFLNPVAADEPNGFQVRFIYNGPGAIASDSVGNLGAEMQKVINDKNANGLGVTASALFSFAEGGPSTAPPSQSQTASGVFAIAPDGTILFNDGSVYDPGTGLNVNPDGTIKTAATTSPGGGAGSGSQGSSFDLNSMIGGLGIGGVALGLLALVLVVKS